MATYNYKGTKITGTSTSAKVFSKSGIKKANTGDKYLNTEWGHVYNCTEGGKASKAKWAYVRTDIIAPPDIGYSNLCAPVRGDGNRKMTATWHVPPKLVDEKNGRRATELMLIWTLGIDGKHDPGKVSQKSNQSLNTNTINLDNCKCGAKTYTRQSFYPNSTKKLKHVTFEVLPLNDCGNGMNAKQTRNFYKPETPSLSAFTFDKETGEVKCTITTDAGAGYKERYDTHYQIFVKKSWEPKETLYEEGNTFDTSKTVKYDARGYQGLDYNQHIRVRVKAWARGYAGDSEPVEKRYFVSYPAQPSIKGVTYSGFTGTDKITVKINTNQVKNKYGRVTHPTDKITLEYLANVDYAKASDIPAEEDWEDSGNIDDAQCTALALPVADVVCDAGKWSWIRAVAYHANEDVLFRYSEYKRLDELHKDAPTAADDEIVVVSALPNADGVSADVTLAWDADGTDDSTGTELSWDTEKNAWRSTKEPNTYEFTWYDSGTITHKGKTYRKHATITIKDLNEGETYYIRARRYLEGDVTTYSNYSPDVEPVTTTPSAEAIVASCNPYVSVGESLPITWTLSGGGLQKEWSIVQVAGYDEHGDPIDGTPIASGTGSIGYTQIDASRLATFATNNVVTFTVQASTGTKPVKSETHTVRIAQRPTLTISVPQTLTTNALSITATASTVCDLSIVVTSQGVDSQTPTGMKRQANGDTVYSVLNKAPSWSESSGSQVATIALPTDLDFWDLGNYTVTVIAIDRTSGLQSEPAVSDVNVNWARKAPNPADAVTITAVDEVDDTGYHIKGADITLTPPTGSVSTDVYDIYRYTGDGAVLIGEGFPLTYTARDLYAPYSEDGTQHYRIAVRTADGDTEFADIEYISEGEHLRFDWSEGYLELPYGVTISDSYGKDVEFRQHMDGGTDGYWNPNIERKGSYSSAVIKLVQSSETSMARKLARFAGTVFVRTPEGTAYLADVQVTDLSKKNEAVMLVAFDATEVDITDEYKLPTPYEKQDEEES